jgi:predicted TIM-barrel enzyme
VVDLSGLNRFCRSALDNAGHAIAGMARGRQSTQPTRHGEEAAMTMFGSTTPCVTRVATRLREHDIEPVTFHANGIGGCALEKWLADGEFSGVFDITTTELADELVGGHRSAGPERMEAAGRRGIAQVVAPGALDMVNFGPPDTVPPAFEGRLMHHHNPGTTLMRTTRSENARLGDWMAEKLNRARGPVGLVLPLRGFSAYDIAGGPFFDRTPTPPLRQRRQERPQARHPSWRWTPTSPRVRRRRPRSALGLRAGDAWALHAERGRARLDGQIALRPPIVAAGAGCGLTAEVRRSAVRPLVIYNSGRYRMAGLPSLVGYLPVGDANAVVLEMGRREIFPVAGDTRDRRGARRRSDAEMRPLLEEVRSAGFSGVINFPTVGRMDGAFRRALEEVGLGYAREAAMIALARELDLFTLAYCFTPEEAAMMAASGVDTIVAHLKTTAGGLVGLSSPLELGGAFEAVTRIFDARGPPLPACCAWPTAGRSGRRRTRPSSIAIQRRSASWPRQAWSGCRPRTRSSPRPVPSSRNRSPHSGGPKDEPANGRGRTRFDAVDGCQPGGGRTCRRPGASQARHRARPDRSPGVPEPGVP